MSDLSTSTISIEAPLSAVSELLFALDKYPEWSTSIKAVEVLGSDDQGRITKAKMTIDAGMMKDRVILDYDWSQAPAKLSFSLDDADLLTAMDGSYEISRIDDDTTQVRYSLTVDLSMPIPAMMRQKAEKATIDQALSQLKSALEA
ncbi:MAG: polyketide cyclase / dehydrase and lipid transport [Actinobacteria bacterium]|jgi:uncharacterized membrane protein|uniref:Unannotated protein n=1 Tax=freshwater metagenome TaxID=449393 RepID=A0A6J7PF25_9ZZZZ|nr:SRPBCC family protein [Actinomycetota bacterium]MSV39123.1 polyketide cyclase / dehydrase and lipid transport [Actinomycetota bacterium]MSY48966.1 polyketide cyclase / dehydrase and lipid transport [Actinomycetota bacterium]MTH91932.1 polyketide cyclase / dehydrase and lipid transport [Actinomycetota bacterium]